MKFPSLVYECSSLFGNHQSGWLHLGLYAEEALDTLQYAVYNWERSSFVQSCVTVAVASLLCNLYLLITQVCRPSQSGPVQSVTSVSLKNCASALMIHCGWSKQYSIVCNAKIIATFPEWGNLIHRLDTISPMWRLLCSVYLWVY